MEKEKLKPGRKRLPEDQRKKIVTAYLTEAEKTKVTEKWGNLTKAVRHLLNQQ